MREYTLVFEFQGTTGWTGSVRQLPGLARVRGCQLSELQYQLASQLVEMLWESPDSHDVCITTEVHYHLANSSQQLSDN
jgi:hypothetical protein